MIDSKTAALWGNIQIGAWKWIETAPRDGTDILLANALTMAVGQWSESRDPRYSCWQLTHTGGYAGDGLLDFDPTHWMPLPPLPETIGDKL